ncbi:uncharacterized protein [Henckelia pumila]|uniref:uncharacterized protein n=1 Tax=Henckelia pumila TaxID=405737 RepID=UPI003C6DC8C5
MPTQAQNLIAVEVRKNSPQTRRTLEIHTLTAKKYSSVEKICIHGRSAGGLLVGAVLNMRPDLFKDAVAGEWGDPRKEEFYFYMKSYSPVDNVKAQNYPAILLTAGLNGKSRQCLPFYICGGMEPMTYFSLHDKLKTGRKCVLRVGGWGMGTNVFIFLTQLLHRL